MAVLGVDFFNETMNSFVMILTNYAGFWTSPNRSALKIFVGWNIEIMFMFSLLGIIFYYFLSPEQSSQSGKNKSTINGKSVDYEKYIMGALLSFVCVMVENYLNIAN